MSIRGLIKAADRGPGRLVLAALATGYARFVAGSGVRVVYDGLWMHQVGAMSFPDGRHFRYGRDGFRRWKDQAERYEANARDFWMQHSELRPGDVVIDVGAGHGEDTYFFSRAVGPKGLVVAIEAHPEGFEILQKFCRLNTLQNVRPIHAAVMDAPGTVTMAGDEKWEEAVAERGADGGGVQVPARTLDELCDTEGIGQIALLKMNIEGAEVAALQGMPKTLAKLQTICVACHDFRADRGDGEYLRTRKFVTSFLADHGFRVVSRPDDPRDYVRDHIYGLRRG